MMRRLFTLVLLLGSACSDSEPQSVVDGGLLDGTVHAPLDASFTLDAMNPDSSFDWRLPKGFPLPPVPADNPMTAQKVELGRYLFYDERLSENQTFSCANCHRQELAFTDGRAVGLGSTGELHSRSSMTLANVAYAPTLTWANPLMKDLEHQVRVPIFGDRPIELGMPSIRTLEARLRAVAGYVTMFGAAFPDDEQPLTVTNLLHALSAFQRSIVSGNSAFDRWQAGDDAALSPAAKRGHQLFNSERLECFHCHGGFAFTDHATWAGKPFDDAPYHQTGLYNLDGRGSYPPPNTGVYETSLDMRDMGKFKAPTLRNVAVTAPYMHDGSIATLSEVIDHYAAGGRAHSFRTDPLLVGFTLDDAQRADLIAFLESLTDEAFLRDPRYADPGQLE